MQLITHQTSAEGQKVRRLLIEEGADIKKELYVSLVTDRGQFHHDPLWTYMVAHPEEKERGLDAAGDLFSPGWFELPLEGTQAVALTAARKDDWAEEACRVPARAAPLDEKRLTAPLQTAALLPFPGALSQALSLYVVRRDALDACVYD